MGCLAVDLADTGFADTQNFPDFLEVKFFFVVKRKDQLFPFGQGFDGGRQLLAEVVAGQFIKRIVGMAILETGVDMVVRRLQIAHAEEFGGHTVLQHGEVIIQADTQFLGHFTIRGIATGAELDSPNGFLMRRALR